MKVGLDLDGVVIDFADYFLNKINSLYKTKHTKNDWTSYYFNVGNFNDNHFKDMVNEIIFTGGWKHMEPLPNAVEAVKDIYENNSIHIITGKRGRAKSDVVHWLERYDIPYDSISFTDSTKNNVVHSNKGKLGYILGLDCMIEDSHKNAEDMSKYGIITFLIDQPWNRVPLSSLLIQRVNSLKDLSDILKWHE